ncbi:MAG: type II toxin-antitoxin system YafQ family toxin [Oscillospiraceae bacterium]|jgi:hypothetical protein|nr:type II toxin-antitoxin system YafQ family toxin [Oscillospiraceae bacterium]
MLEIFRTSQFKKDFKTVKRRSWNTELLKKGSCPKIVEIPSFPPAYGGGKRYYQ